MVTAASKDFQANIMDYCDIAWSGEDVFIPRSGDNTVSCRKPEKPLSFSPALQMTRPTTATKKFWREVWKN